MRIDELIKLLEQIKKQHGNIECVQEIDDFFGKKKINSTIENVNIVDFDKGKAVQVDWRTEQNQTKSWRNSKTAATKRGC